MARFVNDQAVLRRDDGPFRPFGREFRPRDLFASGADGAFYDMNNAAAVFEVGTTPATYAGAPLGRLADLSGNGLDATNTATVTDYFQLREDRFGSAQRTGAPVLSVTLPDLGAAATLAYCYWNSDGDLGVSITGGLTIGAGAYALPAVERLGPVVVIGRALTPSETDRAAAWLAARTPGKWALGLGVWDDAGVWVDTAYWQDGIAA